MSNRFVAAAMMASLLLLSACGEKPAEPPKAQATATDDAANAKAKADAAAAKVAETRQIAEDAYVYGYSLITTEVTRVQMRTCDKLDELHGADEPVRQRAALSAGGLSRRLRAECRHAVFAGVARSRRAAGVQPSGHGQALLSVPDGRPVDDDFRKSPGTPHRRRQGRELSDHRSRLERRRAEGHEAHPGRRRATW